MCRLVFPSVELSGERAADEAVQVSREPVLKGLAKARGHCLEKLKCVK